MSPISQMGRPGLLTLRVLDYMAELERERVGGLTNSIFPCPGVSGTHGERVWGWQGPTLVEPQGRLPLDSCTSSLRGPAGEGSEHWHTAAVFYKPSQTCKPHPAFRRGFTDGD